MLHLLVEICGKFLLIHIYFSVFVNIYNFYHITSVQRTSWKTACWTGLLMMSYLRLYVKMSLFCFYFWRIFSLGNSTLAAIFFSVCWRFNSIVFKKKIFLFLLIFWPCCTDYGILVPRPRVEPVSPAVEALSLNPWTTRNVPICYS